MFRVSFGLALAMALTPARFVTSGYYRVHLYVLLGMNALTTLVAVSDHERFSIWIPAVAAALSYVGAVAWLYEKPRAGTALLGAVSLVAFLGALTSTSFPGSPTAFGILLAVLDLISSGLVLGVTLAAMLLGHWYLNTPTMQLLPLKRLVGLLIVAVFFRTLLCGTGLGLRLWEFGPFGGLPAAFVALRWLSGLVGTLVLAIMTWETLKIPNTQSATGLLYVAVMAAFVGELTAQLLSVNTLYPV